LYSKQCADKTTLSPCIFEYVYLARPDSTLDGISVYEARIEMGRTLAAKIKREWKGIEIDSIIPIPETSNDIALQMSIELDIPYRQGFVKNRYIGRTFIMPGQTERRKSVRRKLNPIRTEFADKIIYFFNGASISHEFTGNWHINTVYIRVANPWCCRGKINFFSA
jgi:amidophosphoribosyltransferase